MKITKEQLKRIIKEELEAVMEVGGRTAEAINEEPETSPRGIAKGIGDKIKQMDAWFNIQPDLAKQDIEDLLPRGMDLERLANLLGDMEGYESVAKFIDLMD